MTKTSTPASLLPTDDEPSDSVMATSPPIMAWMPKRAAGGENQGRIEVVLLEQADFLGDDQHRLIGLVAV